MKEKILVLDALSYAPTDEKTANLIREYSDGIPNSEFVSSRLARVFAYADLHSPGCDIVSKKLYELSKEQLMKEVRSEVYKYIIISGSANSVNGSLKKFDNVIEVIAQTNNERAAKIIGICVGIQIVAVAGKGAVSKLPEQFYGWGDIYFNNGETTKVWRNNLEYVSEVPEGAAVVAWFDKEKEKYPAVIEFPNGDIGYQHHPEKLVV